MKSIKINWKAIPDAFKLLGRCGKENLPTILVGFGVIGFGATLYLTADAAPKAKEALEEEEAKATEEQESEEGENDIPVAMTFTEKAKIVAPYYWKPAITGMLTLGCFLGAHKVNLSRLSSLGAMYALAKGDLKDLKDKIVQTDGEKKLDELHESIIQDKRENADYDDIYDTHQGNVIFIDCWTGRTFKSSIVAVNRAITSLNNRLMQDQECGLDDFLYDLNLKFDVGCAKHFKFIYSTSNDLIHDYQIMKYGPKSSVDATPVCYLDYGDRLIADEDMVARSMRFWN